MKKALILLFALSSVLFFSCGRNDQYRIHGRVTANDLEDMQIVLVPLGHETAEFVESVHIHNHAWANTTATKGRTCSWLRSRATSM